MTPHSEDSLLGEAFNCLSTQLANRPIAWQQLCHVRCGEDDLLVVHIEHQEEVEKGLKGLKGL